MNIIQTKEFQKELLRLPLQIRKIYKKQEEFFLINPKDPRLHVEKLKGCSTFSLRVTRQYRILFEFVEENLALFVSIGHRKDIYR
jgi:mRNA-degrading endonuclease RelE of RelBE toxin-antitoxin system